MKKYLFVSMIVLAFVACQKGDTGPAGPQGAPGLNGSKGAQGPQGIAGNANVMQYTYGAQNLANGFAQLQVTTTLDTMNRSQWFVYLYNQNDLWYFVPGFGYGGLTQYRVYMGYSGSKVNIYIDRAVGAGETYAKARIIRIYASSETTGGRVALDFTDYKAVQKFYNLPD
jgi:hypothetical protein